MKANYKQMIIETQYLSRSKKLLISYITPKGKMETEYFDWETPFKYVRCSENDPEKDLKYHAWEGDPIKKVYGGYPDRYATYEFLDSLKMSEEQYNKIFGFNLPDTYFIDIETEVVDGFPDPETAPTMIQSISIVFDDKIILYGLKPLSKEEIKRIEEKTNEYFKNFDTTYQLSYIKFEDEFNMLYHFFNTALKNMPCITGWNFLDFDFRFLVNRAEKLTKESNGKLWTIEPRLCSYSRKMNHIWKTNYQVPAHKLVFDYMLLYKSLDTTVKVKESNSLDFVSKELLGVGKIDHSGSLMELYEEDFEKFMYYNAVDSVLVQKIHERGGYLNIIFAIASLAKIQATDVYSYSNGALGSLAITEGVLREKFRNEENVVFFGESSDDKSARIAKQKIYDKNGNIIEELKRIEGGGVKPPAVGVNKWVACYDFASLYPTTQRQFFIAPENFIGVSINKDDEYFKTAYGKDVKIDREEDVIIKVENKAVQEGQPGRFIYKAFKKKYSPTLKMLEEIYNNRKKEKKKMMKIKLEIADLEKKLDKLKNTL